MEKTVFLNLNLTQEDAPCRLKKTKETKLARRLAEGDTKALEKIIDFYSGYVRTIIRNISKGLISNEDMDELTYDVFYKLWCHREEIDGEIGIRPYLSAIARNTAKDYFKKRTLPYEDISELEISSGFLVEDKAVLHEMMKCLKEGIETLSQEDSEIFQRFYLYAEKNSQIANALNMPEGTVRTRLYRIRTKLKNYMMERGFEYV